jgi:phenylacetate-CoA ligase
MTLTPREYSSRFDHLLGDFLRDAAARAPGLAARLQDAGLRADDATNVAVLDRLPVLTKDRVLELQARDPPFADLVASDFHPRRVFQSPGPLYEAEPDGEDHWRWRPALESAGFGRDDVVLNAFAYHLTPAGAMFEEACRQLGATVFPGGVGNLDAQVRACADLGVSAYVGLPSYLKSLLEAANKLASTRPLRLRRAFVTGEPLPDSLRAWLLERLDVVRQGYGTAETGNLGYECSQMAGWHVAADALVQICDLTSGAAIHDSRQGQIVVTVFSPSVPVVRFGTGDISAWHTESCTCDIGTPRLRGWLGRVGDAVKVRGMFLHPRQIADVMDGIDGVRIYRFVVDRVGHRDILRCALVTDAGGRRDVASDVRTKVRASLRFDVDVELVGDLPEEGPVIQDLRSWE